MATATSVSAASAEPQLANRVVQGYAAILGTAAEIGLPALLVLGLGTRFTAFALFIFNIIATTSYPDLSPAGFKDHVLWGALLMVTFFYGPGKIALDHWLKQRFW